MPCFGGFCPMPLRLGGSQLDGWAPGQHARTAADVVAVTRSAPFARLRTWVGVDGILAYQAQHGSGIALAPTVTVVGGGLSQVVWPDAVADAMGVMAPVSIRHARAKSHRTAAEPEAATVRIISPTTILLYSWHFVVGAWGSNNGIVDLVVY
jgi:hypothetical protein